MQTLTLLHSETFPIGRYTDALTSASIASLPLGKIDQLKTSASLRVVVLDPSNGGNGQTVPVDARTALVGVGWAEQPGWLTDESIYLDLPNDPAPDVLLKGVKRAFQFLYQKIRADQLERQLSERTRELEEVTDIGAALSTVRDHQVLLTMILQKARDLSRADAGSLYLLDEMGGGKVLRWKLAQNDSFEVDFEERILPITKKSLAGYVALTGETLVIDDAYDLPKDAEYSINRSFDEENEYLTKSILVFPMISHVGELMGVLQLINRKVRGAPKRLTAETVPDNVISFDQEIVDVMRSLAAQAAVAVENNLLYESIERLFEGFVTAAVTAIEQRDPTTSGHSFRVADLTVELAKVIDKIDQGQYQQIHFSPDQIKEIRYASLLHDFGKVGVREQVLVKEKKLYPNQIDSIRSRFEFVIKSVEADGMRRKLDFLLKNDRAAYDVYAAQVDRETQERIAQLQHDFAFISQSNEPTVLPEGEFQYLQSLAERDFQDIRGESKRLLTSEEVRILSIRKGNLDAGERTEIESHVTHTFNFLQKIPWTKDLASVADIAYKHHEKLNGRGYPRKLSAQDIPIQSRMMTVSDIYDALTANDRPYKRAISTERALDILQMEMKDGLLDQDLVHTFIESRVYERAGILRP